MEGELMKLIAAMAVLCAISGAHAAKIAVIDSGLDYKHEMITPNLWTNANETFDRRDEDGNGYQDDVHGWNFAESNGQIIDYKYLGTFSANPKKYFDIQGKRFLNQATEAELAWMKAIVQDKDFMKEMAKFGNFVHGTHVAGITIRDSNNEAMGIKLLPTETKLIFDGLRRQANLKADKWELLNTAFTALAAEQMKLLTSIAKFAAFHKADVANGSFGTGFNQAKMITNTAFKILFFRKPTEEESNKASKMFIDAMVSEGKNFVGSAPSILFVFAAGNDGMSNDIYGTSPANIKADNVITVGATYKNEFFAPFSNFGTKMVDLAAPGMLINSAIPGNDYLQVSGTSQASPYVANVAAKIKSANMRLSPLDIKKILMGTVDKKAFLADKVMAGGIVNLDRAVVAANMTNTMSVSEAISRSKSQVKDAPVAVSSQAQKNAVIPMDMPAMFR
jgi:cell wall-associated protease